MRGWIGTGGLILFVAVTVTACGGGGSQQGGGQQGGTASAATITIAEEEWKITDQPATAKAGTIKFVIKNQGTIEHNFVIKELNQEVATSIQPGQSKEATVTLKPGTYTLVCNIPGHEEAGMHTTLKVGE